MRVAVIQMPVLRGERQHNWDVVQRRVDSLMREHPQTDVIVLPELWSSGYALERAQELSSPLGEREAAFLGSLAVRYGVSFAGGSVLSQENGSIYNRAQIIAADGTCVAGYNKIHLFRLIDEDKFLGQGQTPLNFTLNDSPCAAVLCYDIRFCELPRLLALNGAQVLFVSAQWPLSRHEHWTTLLRARAIENQMYVVACNCCGLDNNVVMGGHSQIIAPDGTLLASAEAEEATLTAVLAPELVKKTRATIPVFADRVPALYRTLVD